MFITGKHIYFSDLKLRDPDVCGNDEVTVSCPLSTGKLPYMEATLMECTKHYPIKIWRGSQANETLADYGVRSILLQNKNVLVSKNKSAKLNLYFLKITNLFMEVTKINKWNGGGLLDRTIKLIRHSP